MPQNADELVKILSLRVLDAEMYEGSQPDDSRMVRVFGGQVIGQALAAASASVDDQRLVHSLHAYFVLGADPSHPIRYEVNRVRDGGSFTTRRVSAIQHDREICHVMASFHRKEAGHGHSMARHFDADPRQLPTVTEILAERGGIDAEFWDHEWRMLEMRVEPPAEREGGVLGHRIWFRLRDEIGPSQQLHRTALAYISDLTLLGVALLPHGYFIGDSQVQRASLDHSVWFHDDVNVNDWLIYDQVSPWAGGGRGLARAEIYARSGRLVASVAQEGLMRPRDHGNGEMFRS